jgi:hypothetical protein
MSAVTAVLRAMVGLQLISISHGFRSSPSMKSAPNSSKEFYEGRHDAERTRSTDFSRIDCILSDEHRTDDRFFHRWIDELVPSIGQLIRSKILLDELGVRPHILI